MNTDFLKDGQLEFRRLRSSAEKALDQVGDTDFFRSPGEDQNSLAILVKHLAGNMRSRWRDFSTSDGEKADRNRDQEFVLTEADTRVALMEAWDRGWTLLFGVMDEAAEVGLDHAITIRGEPFTVRQAILRQMTHAAYHVGQIVQLAHRWRGTEWSYLSIPPGRSQEFNAAPGAYRADER